MSTREKNEPRLVKRRNFRSTTLAGDSNIGFLSIDLSRILGPMNITKSVLIGVVSGLLYFQMDYTDASIQDRSSYFVFTMTYWVIDSMFRAFMTFSTEREVVLKERASGSYRLSAYFLAKTTSELPASIILPCLYMVISFWMASISTSFVTFLSTVGITLLSVMAGETLGLLVGSTVYDLWKRARRC